jgi:hypothetical protein
MLWFLVSGWECFPEALPPRLVIFQLDHFYRSSALRRNAL